MPSWRLSAMHWLAVSPAEFSYVPTTNNKGTVRFGVGGTQNGSDNSVYGGLMKHYLGK